VAQAQITPGFQPGNLCVLRVGNGTDDLDSAGDPVFLLEYTTNGVLTNTVAIPDSGSNSLIIGSATSEGAISRSANSNFIVMVGYNTNYPYTSSLSGSASTAVPRGIATIDFNGNYNFITNTRPNSAETTSAAEPPTARIISGPSGPSAARFTWACLAARHDPKHAGQQRGRPYFQRQPLLFRTEDGALRHLFLCRPARDRPMPAPAAFSTGSSSSPYGFAISPDNTVAYVADDRAVASGGGIQKYTNNGTWGLAYTFGTGAGSTVGARGLVVEFGEAAGHLRHDGGSPRPIA
jgi:hypothetical protein